jgi:hypothetical protein
LQGKEEGEAFSNVHDLDFFHSMMVDVIKEDDESKKGPSLKVTAMPGKHVPDGVLGTLNDLIQAVSLRDRDIESTATNCQQVPPTNGWMVELGYAAAVPGRRSEDCFECGYRQAESAPHLEAVDKI